MKKIAWLYLSLIVLMCCQCSKSEAPPLVDLDENTYKYTIFQQNSHWIYQSERFNQRDSVAVLRSEILWFNDNNLPYQYTAQEMDFYSSYYNKKFFQRSEAYHMNSPDGFSIHILWAQDGLVNKCTFFSNRSTGAVYNYWFQPENVVTYQEFLPTYTLEGKTYSDVMVFESRYTGRLAQYDDPRLPVRTWYAKHVGIIRKEMHNGDFWNLISYDVKQ